MIPPRDGDPTAATGDRAYVEGLIDRLRAAGTRAHTLAGPLTSEQLNWKPAPQRWGVAQCLDHVITVNRLYLDRMREALPEARPADPGRPFRPGPLGRRFAEALGPGAPRRMKTVRRFAPSASALPSGIVDDFTEQQLELEDVYGQALAVDLTRTRVASPASRLIRFRLGDILVLLANHQERHLGQAERVTKTDGFPTSSEGI